FGPAKFDPEITVFPPPQLLEPIPECRNPNLPSRIALQKVHKHADSPNAPALLRACSERPRNGRAAQQRDELAPSDHSITSSPRTRNASGICNPSTLAVVRLTARSNLVGCSTGRSAGFAPRRILSTYSAARRYRSGKFGP